jgi:PadR family transcriptional regulator PadR
METNRIIKGSLSILVLQLLNNNGKMYGYEISKAVRDASKGQISITDAALYPTLHRLEQKGLVEVEHTTADGRLRKYYKLSRAGKKAAGVEMDALLEAFKSVQRIAKFKIKR